MAQFFNLEEVIQNEILYWKKRLNLKRDVIFITDSTIWKDHLQNSTRIDARPNVYGEAHEQIYHIYINPDKNYCLRDVKNTILHEILHLKYPKKTEAEVLKFAKQYFN